MSEIATTTWHNKTAVAASARLGIYFDLDEAAYHEDEALGSSSMNALAVSPPDYWFDSAMNPLREIDKATPSQIIGSATHKRVLEGRELFEARYAPTDFPGNIKAGIEERKRIAESNQIAIKREDWNRIQMVGAVIQANPGLSSAFTGSCGHEVSIFWEANGLRKKARIDALKLKASVDLKTHTKTKDIPFPRSCRHAIANYNYVVQAEHYREGRLSMAAHVKARRVYGDHDEALLRRVAAIEDFSWVWIFVQSTGAPLTYGLTMTHGNGLYDIARNIILKAEEHYQTFMKEFGRDIPWMLMEHISELHVEEMPAWWGRD